MSKFEMIPQIYAGDLPDAVEENLRNWDEELCFHGDGGCVFSLDGETLDRLPLFTDWMIEIGAWSKTMIDGFPNRKKFEQETGHVALASLSVEEYKEYFTEYYKWVNGRQTSLTVAMTGT